MLLLLGSSRGFLGVDSVDSLPNLFERLSVNEKDRGFFTEWVLAVRLGVLPCFEADRVSPEGMLKDVLLLAT